MNAQNDRRRWLGGVVVAAGAMFVQVAPAAEILVTEDIEVSQTWTADNTYNLQQQIYVLPGATLTIEPGTVIATTPTPTGSGSLAVTRGARIIAEGTPDAPIVFTSTADDFSTWREAANEWGNVTLMGRGFISNSFVEGNEPTCDAMNVSPMEGLVPDFPGDPNTVYGGGNDDDNSGTLAYVSIRYGGRVFGLANELNGLSLGGVGRETDVRFVEIMNNVDDGIEIWGGAVDIDHFSIWNVGDDSFDVDQGWRGRAQFGLIVQGYSLDASQGSGVGDNCFETDGAENSDAQPVTTATIYNTTVIGQPFPGAGDGGTAWRDNARVQYRQCIFMDLGERLVRFDDIDGDGSQGYGFNGTLSWPQTWQTPFFETSTANPCPDPASIYGAQSDGRLAEIRDSVFFRNLDANAYSEAMARGVFNPVNDNVLIPGFDEVDSPLAAVLRAEPVVRGGKTMLRVIGLDPRPVGPAAESVGTAPDDGFFCPTAAFRGGFAPDSNWLCGWTAADQYGFVIPPPDGCFVPEECPGQEPDDCPEDFDGDASVATPDLLALLAAWGPCGGCPQDLDGDGIVATPDLLQLLAAWGPCPGTGGPVIDSVAPLAGGFGNVVVITGSGFDPDPSNSCVLIGDHASATILEASETQLIAVLGPVVAEGLADIRVVSGNGQSFAPEVFEIEGGTLELAAGGVIAGETEVFFDQPFTTTADGTPKTIDPLVPGEEPDRECITLTSNWRNNDTIIIDLHFDRAGIGNWTDTCFELCLFSVADEVPAADCAGDLAFIINQKLGDQGISVEAEDGKITFTAEGGLEPGCFGSITRKRECTLVSFDVPKNRSGLLITDLDGGVVKVGESFEMDAEFAKACECCEFRQFVRGRFRVARPGGKLREVPHNLRTGVPMSRTEFREDGAVTAGGDFRYGHRDEAGSTTDVYSNPDRATGCRYDGFDYPGIAWTPIYTYDIDLDFKARIIDVCMGGMIVDEKEWSVEHSGSIIAGEDDDPDPTFEAFEAVEAGGRGALIGVYLYPNEFGTQDLVVVANVAGDGDPVFELDSSEVEVRVTDVDGVELVPFAVPGPGVLPSLSMLETPGAFALYEYEIGVPGGTVVVEYALNGELAVPFTVDLP